MINEIKYDLISYLKDFTSKYENVSVKYEYSEEEHSFIVSYSPRSSFKGNEQMCEYIIGKEKELRTKYFDDAPLFCFDESLYEFSWKATSIEKGEIVNKNAFSPNMSLSFDLLNMQRNIKASQSEKTYNVEFDYKLAA